FLLALPERTAPTHTDGAPATDRQKAFVRTLLAEREGNEAAEMVRRELNKARVECALTAALMSDTIAALLEIPANDSVTVPDGRYALPAEDGHFVFYKVDNVTEGKWAGYTFVVQLLGSVGDWSEQRLDKAHSKSVLARIAANVEEAA